MYSTHPSTTVSRTHVGLKREANEDSHQFYERSSPAQISLAAVADGMGGHGNGQAASEIAIRFLDHVMRLLTVGADTEALEMLRAIPTLAGRRVTTDLKRDLHGRLPGTTFSALWVGDGLAHIVHIGDSRIYRWREKRLEPLTEDHGYVYEELVKLGHLPREKLRFHPYSNVLTRCIGGDNHEPADCLTRSARPGDRFLLCSDGLTDMVSEDDLQKIFLEEPDSKLLADHLLKAALDGGGRDNITLILVDIP